MGLLGRAAGFALLGPIGAVGPTEASKRAKKQLAELSRRRCSKLQQPSHQHHHRAGRRH